MNVKRADESDSDSEHPQKRQRLSSPTYDEQFELSQDEVNAFDLFEQRMSQALSSPTKRPKTVSPQAKRRRDLLIATALGETIDVNSDTNVPASKAPSGFQSAASIHAPQSPSKPPKRSGFSSALDFAASGSSSQIPSSSLAGPTEQDLSAWFESSDIPAGGLVFKSAKELAEAPPDPDEDWFNATPPPGVVLGFQTAKTVKPSVDDVEEQSPSPTPAPVQTFAGFVSGASVAAKGRLEDPNNGDTGHTDATPAFVGFASGSSLLNPAKKATSWAPSAEALAKAAERMKKWQEEIDQEFPDTDALSTNHGSAGPEKDDISRLPGLDRAVLSDVENSFVPGSQLASQGEMPETPTPARIMPMPFTSLKPGSMSDNRKPFKSPLKAPAKTVGTSNTAASTSYVASPLNPSRTSSALPQSKPFAPLRPPLPSTPTRPPSPPKKSLGITPRRFSGSPMPKPTFVTPFKAGMKPGEPGRSQLKTPVSIAQPHTVLRGLYTTPGKKDKGKGRAVYFDLTPPPTRQTLASSGLVPQAYTADELVSMEVDINQLSQITPGLAHYYRFHSTILDSSSISSTPQVQALGPEEAYKELHDLGCDLITKSWVDNHWGLILWKLTGMACLDPQSEQNPDTKRWCWKEVLRQLRYRYERELNRGTRPPLRLIAAHDAPVGLPMVLCISRIEWPEGNGDTLKPLVEVTDGWYRVRAEVDDAMTRAIRRGTLRPGMKVGTVGARFTDPRIDPFEILDSPFAAISPDSPFALRLTGNACHLVPWHAKLGFYPEPFIATLSSLTPDGGRISVMDLVVVKAHPIAWIEFVNTDQGRTNGAPRLEAEESRARAEWQAKRDNAAERIRAKFEKTLHDLETYADRLEIKAGMNFRPGPDDTPPDNIDDLMYSLEDACTNSFAYTTPQDLIKGTSKEEAGWLARAIHDKCAKDRENMGEEIEKELETECPPRDVKDFRVLVMQDAQTQKREVQMAVQITVWDVLSQYMNEDGKPGEFKEGERFIVTNLEPTKPMAWMQREDGAMVYMLTRKDTRWRKVR